MTDIDAVTLWLIWGSVFGFAIHNVEEAFGIQAWTKRHFSPSIAARYRTRPFALATGILWTAYCFLALWLVINPTSLNKIIFLLGFSSIAANAVTHMIANLLFNKNMPGFWSSAFLLIPIALIFAKYGIQTGAISFFALIELFAVGVFLQVPLAFIAITIANRFSR